MKNQNIKNQEKKEENEEKKKIDYEDKRKIKIKNKENRKYLMLQESFIRKRFIRNPILNFKN